MRLFETVLNLKKIPIGKAEGSFKKISAIPAEEFSEYLDNACQDIVHYHFHKTPFYKHFLNGRIPEKWSDIPVLRKRDYQADIEKLISSEFTLKNIYIN